MINLIFFLFYFRMLNYKFVLVVWKIMEYKFYFFPNYTQLINFCAEFYCISLYKNFKLINNK